MSVCSICNHPSDKTICDNCFHPLFQVVPNEKSYAFLQGPIDFSNDLNCKVLDFFYTDIQTFETQALSFPNLEILRLSHCSNLTSVKLFNMPKLKALDISDCHSLTTFEVDPATVPNIVALDLSLCDQLTSFTADLTHCEYLSLFTTKISVLPPLPTIKYLNLNNTKFSDFNQLKTFTTLEKLLIGCNLPSLDLTPIIQFPNLFYLSADNHEKFDEFENSKKIKTNLVFLSGPNPGERLEKCMDDNMISLTKLKKVPKKPTGNDSDFIGWYIFLMNHLPVLGSYRIAEHLLYGPYPPPPQDLYKEEDRVSPKFTPPSQVDQVKAMNHIAGTLFGTGIGDCLGLHCEREHQYYILSQLQGPIDITWTHPLMTKRGTFFHRGSFTDDTALMLLFVRSICEKYENSVDEVNCGAKIKHWIDCGLDEHRDGYGIGQGPSTASVVHRQDFDEHPIAASKAFLDSTNGYSAGNGGVMRTGAVGCLAFWDEEVVIKNAIIFDLITHANPLCVYSSVVISLLIAREIQWRTGLRDKIQDIQQTINDTFDAIERFANENPQYDFIRLNEKQKESCVRYSNCKTIEEIDLPDSHTPPTLQTMAVGVWALRSGIGFAEGIEKVIKAGGDTDTNAAVVGACLGARWGFNAIPQNVMYYFWYGTSINREVTKLCQFMGMNWTAPSTNDNSLLFDYPSLGYEESQKEGQCQVI